jgi:lipopolysaccharide export system protein LptA
MYELQLNRVHRQVNNLFKYLLSTVFLLAMNNTYALSTDKEQDIEIEADTADIDDLNGITIYRGDVVVVQGSIRMTGHTMTVHFDDNGDMELVIMQGTPATYRQLPDDSKNYDEAEALQMEYYALKDYVILKEKALVTKPDGSTMSGKRIDYDTVLSKVIAKGDKSKTGKKKDGRVRMTIKKKKDKCKDIKLDCEENDQDCEKKKQECKTKK